MSSHQHNIRSAVRAFLLTATRDELWKEFEISRDMGNNFRAACIMEIILED